jgi:hypothetical protein
MRKFVIAAAAAASLGVPAVVPAISSAQSDNASCSGANHGAHLAGTSNNGGLGQIGGASMNGTVTGQSPYGTAAYNNTTVKTLLCS